MKYIAIIFLIVFGTNIYGQIDCNNYYSVQSLIEGYDTISIIDTIKINSSRNFISQKSSIFPEVDLKDGSNYTLIYKLQSGNETKYFWTDSLDVIKKIKIKYSEQDAFPPCINEDFIEENILTLIKNRKPVDGYKYSNTCEYLITNCGGIKFNIEDIIKNSKEINLEEKSESFVSQEDLNLKVHQLKLSKDVLFLKANSVFQELIIQGTFLDKEDKVNSILKDTFYLSMIKVKLSQDYSNPIISDKSEKQLRKTGEILEFLIENGQIITWSPTSNSNEYLITLRQLDNSLDIVLNNIVVKSNSIEYSLDYIFKTRIR